MAVVIEGSPFLLWNLMYLGARGRLLPLSSLGDWRLGGARFMETKGRNCSKAHSWQAGVRTKVSPPPSHGAALPPCGRARHVSHARRPLPALLSSFLLTGRPVGLEADRTNACHKMQKQIYKN